MIQPKCYLPVQRKFFCTPLIKENLRVDFAASDYKLNDLELLTLLMLRDRKSPADIAAVTLLPPPVIENVMRAARDISPEDAEKILTLSDAINAFNFEPPQIFSDLLMKMPVLLPKTVELKKSFADTNCAAVVKNCEQVWVADFADISALAKKVLIGRGAGNVIDDLKVLRGKQTTELSFAARELRYLPVVGENNFDGCITFDSARTINAEIPVRKFTATSAAGVRKFCVDLLLGTILTGDCDDSDSEEVTLSFSASPAFEGNELTKKISALYDGGVVDEGIHRVKILVAENVAGDFLCA